MMRAAWLLVIAGACGSDPATPDAKKADAKAVDAHLIDGTGVDAALCAAKPANMVSWWRGENDATDTLGTNQGAMTGGGTYVAGKVGQAFSLSGTSQYVAVADSASLDFADAITIEAWINAAAVTDARIVDKISPGGSNGYYLDVISSKLRWGAGTGSIQSTSNIPAATWVDVAATYDKVALKLYINGSQVATLAQTTAIPVNALGLTIGANSARTGNFFNGKIDEVAVYDRALDMSEIQALFLAGTHGRCAN